MTDPTLTRAQAEAVLARAGLGRPQPLGPGSAATFPDGGAYRIEIPSVETVEALDAVLQEAAARDVTVHRVSQGSGVMMLTDDEIGAMVAASRDAGVELCLFLGPRGTWDVGAQRDSTAGRLGPRARGHDQVWQSVADAQRACALGVRCLLVADEGVLWTLHTMRVAGELPAELRLKVSALTGPANPAAARVLEGLGADSLNVPSDLSLAQYAELRSATAAALDVYIEAPDDIGGFVRHYDAAEIVRCAAPVYLKFGLRHHPSIYPAGGHLRALIRDTAVERVRRARLSLDLLHRIGPAPRASEPGAAGMPAGRRFTDERES